MQKKILAQAVLGLSLGMPLTALADAPKVVVDIAPLHSLVSQVMAGVAEADLIIPAESSPHEYNLRPSQARALAESEVVFWMGEELTPWLEKAMDNVADSAQKVSMLKLENTVTYEFREGASFEGHDHHDHGEHDDDHGEHEHEEHKHEEHHHDDHGHSHDEHEQKLEAHHDEHNHGHDEHKEHDHDKVADKHEHHEEGLVDRVLGFFGADKHEEHGHDEHDKHGHESHDDHDHDHDKEHDHDKHEHGEHDHHDGHHHAHEGVDPHAWLDPENAKHWLADIAATLSKKDPENAATYFANATKAASELDQLMAETTSSIKALGDLKFIVFHDAYQYFEKRFGISASGSISLGDAEDPSPARIEEIRNTVKNLGVNCVFSEPQFNQGLVKSVFDGADAAVGVMDPLGAAIAPGSQHYNALIKGMADSLSVCKK